MHAAELTAAAHAAAEREAWFGGEIDRRVRQMAGDAQERAARLEHELTELRERFALAKAAIGERLALATSTLADAVRLDEGLATELACPSCLAQLSQPILLAPCGHTFCADCVERWRREATRGEFCCPTCSDAEESARGQAGETAVPFRNALVEGLNDRVRAKQLELGRVRNVLRKQQAKCDELLGKLAAGQSTAVSV